MSTRRMRHGKAQNAQPVKAARRFVSPGRKRPSRREGEVGPTGSRSPQPTRPERKTGASVNEAGGVGTRKVGATPPYWRSGGDGAYLTKTSSSGTPHEGDWTCRVHQECEINRPQLGAGFFHL